MPTKLSARGESRRLSADEPGWNLHQPASVARTRGGSNIPHSTSTTMVVDSCSEDEDIEEESETEDELDTEVAAKAAVKPANTRVLLEVAQLQKAFEESLAVPSVESQWY
jgi:hypothetical protein